MKIGQKVEIGIFWLSNITHTSYTYLKKEEINICPRVWKGQERPDKKNKREGSNPRFCYTMCEPRVSHSFPLIPAYPGTQWLLNPPQPWYEFKTISD